MRRARTTAVFAALLLAGCGAATEPVTPSTSAGSTAPAAGITPLPSGAPTVIAPPAMLIVGRAGAGDLSVVDSTTGRDLMPLPVGVPMDDWATLVTAVPDGSRTIVRRIDLSGSGSDADVSLDGAWSLPAVGRDPLPRGLAADGSVLALVAPRPDAPATSPTPSRFAIVDLGRDAATPPRLARTVELPEGFDFDTFSPDGSTLYVIEHLDDQTAGHYQVRAVDVATGRLDPVPVANKSTDAEPMYGSPITQVAHGGTVLTLYRGPEHPFVHALSSLDRFAVCLDLPATGFTDEAAGLDWALVDLPGRGVVDAVNATLGLAVEIDPGALSISRTVTLPASSGSAAADGPRIQLAKFGHGQVGAVGRRAVATSAGGTIVAGGRDGLVAIATKDLSVEWRALPGEAVTSVGLSPDGSTVFALLGTGRIVAVSSTDGSSLGAVPGEGYDRLLAVAEG